METPSHLLKKDVDPQEEYIDNMDASTIQDSQSKQSKVSPLDNFNVGKHAAKTKDKTDRSRKKFIEEYKKRASNVQTGAAIVGGVGLTALHLDVIGGCGTAATFAGLAAGIAGPIVLATATLAYSSHEQSIANKNTVECQKEMDKLEKEFNKLNAIGNGEQVEKSNEELFITNAFTNCIK